MRISDTIRINNNLALRLTLLKQKIGNQLRHPLILNSARIFTGNILIQAVSFLTLPVFTRIYHPEDYGLWGLFIFLSGLIAVVSCLRYELSVMIPESENEAAVLVKVAKTNNLYTFLLLTPVFIAFAGIIERLLHFSGLSWLMFLIPLHAYNSAFNSLAAQWASRKKKFRQLSVLRVIQSISNIVLSFVFGYYLRWEFKGLIFATMLSVVIGNIFYFLFTGVSFFSGFLFRIKAHIKYIRKYPSFFKYSSPLAVLNYFTGNILNYLLQVNFGSVMLGLYTNSTRLINTPLSLISASFSSVFYQQFSRAQNKLKLLLVSFFSLLIIFTLLLLPFLIWGEQLIVWYLGADWKQSADFIRILSVVTILSFAMSSVSTLFAYIQKENVVLIWQICYLLIILLVFVLCSDNYRLAMWLYSITGGAAYLILFIIGYLEVKKKQS